MRIDVDKNFVKFNTNNLVNKREFKATPLEFTFTKDYEGLTCKAVFSIIPKTKDEEITFYQQPIIANKCYIPYEVMEGEGVLIGVYGYAVDGEELVLRYSPEPKNLWFLEGSYYEGAEEPEEILPSQFEQYTAYLNSQIARLDQMKIETEDLSNGVKISITNSDGITTETTIYDGEKGEQGERGPEGPQGPAGQNGTNGTNGRDGYVQYTAGSGISISNNTISALPQEMPIYLITGTSQADVDKINECCNLFSQNKPFLAFYKSTTSLSNKYIQIRFFTMGGNIYMNFIGWTGYSSQGQTLAWGQIYGTGTPGEFTEISIYDDPSNYKEMVDTAYVDGIVGSINTALASLTTPGGGN